MSKSGMTGTRWFAMSGRELAILAIAAAAVFAVVGTVELYERLWAPRQIDAAEGGGASPVAARLNINTARDFDLEALPRIGPVTARAIVEYRESHGPFRSLEDLKNVKGIGPVKLEAIRPYAMCAPVPEPTRSSDPDG